MSENDQEKNKLRHMSHFLAKAYAESESQPLRQLNPPSEGDEHCNLLKRREHSLQKLEKEIYVREDSCKNREVELNEREKKILIRENELKNAHELASSKASDLKKKEDELNHLENQLNEKYEEVLKKENSTMATADMVEKRARDQEQLRQLMRTTVDNMLSVMDGHKAEEVEFRKSRRLLDDELAKIKEVPTLPPDASDVSLDVVTDQVGGYGDIQTADLFEFIDGSDQFLSLSNSSTISDSSDVPKKKHKKALAGGSKSSKHGKHKFSEKDMKKITANLKKNLNITTREYVKDLGTDLQIKKKPGKRELTKTDVINAIMENPDIYDHAIVLKKLRNIIKNST